MLLSDLPYVRIIDVLIVLFMIANIYLKTKEISRLHEVIRKKDKHISRLIKVLRKQDCQGIVNIKDGDLHINRVDQRTKSDWEIQSN